ncbi:uncharacterized protein SCODWIG_01171 [Saccharomycodes ludwigii]|uniref:Mitochondrial carrier protein n=1 Tax=Saccharomycodes ludwigii TaxID=36035 RepID=A0A376B5K5_9ASCO|nr:hypothetical protein SCDLUD_002274 [Saccharomycodes ludwigii]KAH3900821.1 hypothetical protein SCDLUD_002274 [Saccharomycodes ludwigii]SSD59410.1 uncharacterized protein SCODWIG_01171 [Saccharomycodes ludwigii]
MKDNVTPQTTGTKAITSTTTEFNPTVVLLGNTASSIFTTSVTQPFEFLKVGQQLNFGSKTFNMLHKVKYYFTGLSSMNISVIGRNLITFGVYNQVLKSLQNYRTLENSAKIPFFNNPENDVLIAGIAAIFTEGFWSVPFENIKTRMIENALLLSQREQQDTSSNNANNSNIHNERRTFHKKNLPKHIEIYEYYQKNPSIAFHKAVREIAQKNGIRGFFNASGLTIIRSMGNASLSFTFFNFLKNKYNQDNSEVISVALGLTSSSLIVGLTQPIDVVKTRMQSSQYAHHYYRNSVNCFYRMFIEEGYRSFYKGWCPRLFKIGIVNGGVGFGIYQYVENLVNLMNGEKKLKS